MPVKTAAGVRIVLGNQPTPPTDPTPDNTGINMPCTITADSLTKGEVPVYVRQFDDHMLLVDAAGNQIGEQESLTLSTFEFDSINKVTTTLAYQGFWNEGVAKEAEAKRLALVVELLRADESVVGQTMISRKAQLSLLATEAVRIVTLLINAGDLELVDDAWSRTPAKILRPARRKEPEVQGESKPFITEVAGKTADNMQLGQTFCSGVLRSDDLQAEMQPGEALTAVGFSIDPLESAIDQTVRLIAECQGSQEVRLTSHLDQLLALQLKRAEQAD